MRGYARKGGSVSLLWFEEVCEGGRGRQPVGTPVEGRGEDRVLDEQGSEDGQRGRGS
jgi:hypothetical protein